MTLHRMLATEHVDLTTLLAMDSEWEALRREADPSNPFTTWGWVGSWLEVFGPTADLEVTIARDPETGRLVGVAPFHVAPARRGGIPVRELRMLTAGVTAPDHLDLLVDPEAPVSTAEALWSAVNSRRRWHLLNLDGIRAHGHLAGVALRRRDDAPGILPCPYLPLEGGWEAVEAGMSGRLTSNLARYGRKLDRDAAVSEWMVTDHAAVDETFDHLVEFHQDVRRAKGDPGVFAQTATRAFLRLAAHRLLDAGRLRLWRLDVDDNPIAVIYCIRAGDVVAFYTTGYDREWAGYGPGRRIMARAIRGAIDEGAAEFDFLRGAESYKSEWGTAVRDDLIIRRATSPRGRALWFARGLTGRVVPGTGR